MVLARLRTTRTLLYSKQYFLDLCGLNDAYPEPDLRGRHIPWYVLGSRSLAHEHSPWKRILEATKRRHALGSW